jgi:cytochrome c
MELLADPCKTPCKTPRRRRAAWVAAAALAALAGCSRPEATVSRFTEVPGGDAPRGLQLLARYQCGSCHVIPEVPAATGRVGPTLASFGARSYIAGHIPNGPQNLQQWLQDPPAMVAGTRMPDLGVSPADARDMAAWLLSMR